MTRNKLYRYYMDLVLSDILQQLRYQVSGSYPYMMNTLQIVTLVYGIICYGSDDNEDDLPRDTIDNAIIKLFTGKEKDILFRYKRTILDGVPQGLEISTYALAGPHMSKDFVEKNNVSYSYYRVNVLIFLRDILQRFEPVIKDDLVDMIIQLMSRRVPYN